MLSLSALNIPCSRSERPDLHEEEDCEDDRERSPSDGGVPSFLPLELIRGSARLSVSSVVC